MADDDEAVGVVRVGSVVRIRGCGDDTEQEVAIGVMPGHREPLAYLPVQTPLGRALLGRREGDDVTVATDAGKTTFTIVSIAPMNAFYGGQSGSDRRPRD